MMKITQTIESLRQQLAECQATNGKLREALRETTAALEHRWEVIANRAAPIMETVIDEAHTKGINYLALPNDATALNELIEAKVAERTAEVEKQLDAMRKAWNVDELIAERTASLTAEVERLNERQDFAPDQWWVKELESIETTLRPITHDQYRAVRIAVTAVKVSMHDNEELRQQNAELTAQRDAAMMDAERYRKARKTGVAKRGQSDLIIVYNERADEAIDAAIANCKEPGV